MILQRTLKQEIRATGVGLHSGEQVEISFLPAKVNTGIVFKRIDLTPAVIIPAKTAYVVDTSYSTTIGSNGVSVMTIEHLMSALYGLGIDNVIIELNNLEVPIMDGSAHPFIFLLQSAGIIEQAAPKKFLQIVNPVVVRDDDKWVKIEPANGLKVNLSLDYDHPVIVKGGLEWQLNFSSTSYIKDISRARTFGFVADLEIMRAANLALGGSLANAIVLDTDSVMNVDGLRYDNEFVKHKILDAIGDLYLAGYPVLGAVTGFKSGHTLNHKLLQTVLSNPSNYNIVDITKEQLGSAIFGEVTPYNNEQLVAV